MALTASLPFGTNQATFMRITVQRVSKWESDIFAKAPLELLLCDKLSPSSKLLWIVLANASRFGSIDKSVLDKMIGVHRSTRIRCMKELKWYGLITGGEVLISIPDPIPILKKMITDSCNEGIEIKGMLDSISTETVIDKTPPKEKDKKEEPSNFELATLAWNSFRPKDYSKINRLSSQLLQSIDHHIKALNLKAHSYEEFFSVLKAGIEHSDFWSKENSSKTLQSITGIGSPQSKKYQNVYNLYNEGLNYNAATAIKEQDRSDELVISSKYRQLIDQYDELHFSYYNLNKSSPKDLHLLNDQILEIESKLRAAGLDPARFRMKYQLDSWPSDVPEPAESRVRFWRYNDER